MTKGAAPRCRAAEGILDENRSAVGVPPVSELGVARIALVGRPEGGVAIGRLGRHLVIGAETEVIEVVVRLDDDVAVGELRLEMGGIGGAVADLEGADDRAPLRAVRPNRPHSPQVMAAQPLRFERAEHDPPILEHHGMQGHAEVQVADAFDVTVAELVGLRQTGRVVHDEELQRQRIGRIAGLGRLEGVAIADEGQLAAGHRAGAHVVDAPGGQRCFCPVGSAGVRREDLLRELDVRFVGTWIL